MRAANVLSAKSMARLAGGLAVIVGGLVLAGWALNNDALKAASLGRMSMKANAALAFVLSGIGLWLQTGGGWRVTSDGTDPASPVTRHPSRLARICAMLTGLIGLLTLSEYVFGLSLGIDQLLFLEPSGTLGTSHPGRMAPDTALCFVLLAAALEAAGAPRENRWALRASVNCGALVTAVGFVAMLCYSTPSLDGFGWWGFTKMSLPTATLFAALGGAIAYGGWQDAVSPRHTGFSSHVRLMACMGVALAAAFVLYVRSREQIDLVNDLRHRSWLLADELRQSGDDLTRMARTYAVTGDPIYKQHFQDILDIRDGRTPRPENYSRPYWDLVLKKGPMPRAARPRTIALLELMRQAGFTEEEFRKLAEAKANSDGLTIPEFEAMRLVESTGPWAEANHARARQMMFDGPYHQAKASVMGPISDFMELVDQRTLAAVRAAQNSATIFLYIFVAVGLGLMFVVWRGYVALGNTLGGAVDEVYGHIARIGRGDFTSPISVKPGLGNSVLGWLSETQAKLDGLDRERKRAEEVRQRSEEKAAWLASFPERNPIPIVEVDVRGTTIDYVNPAAARMFPGLRSQGLNHPWLAALSEAAKGLIDGSAEFVIREVQVAEHCYQQNVHFMPETRRVRIYGADITERKRAEEALRRQTEDLRERNQELTHFNQAATGRELRMIELKQEINAICRQFSQPPRYAVESLDEPVQTASPSAVGGISGHPISQTAGRGSDA